MPLQNDFGDRMTEYQMSQIVVGGAGRNPALRILPRGFRVRSFLFRTDKVLPIFAAVYYPKRARSVFSEY